MEDFFKGGLTKEVRIKPMSFDFASLYPQMHWIDSDARKLYERSQKLNKILKNIDENIV